MQQPEVKEQEEAEHIDRDDEESCGDIDGHSGLILLDDENDFQPIQYFHETRIPTIKELIDRDRTYEPKTSLELFLYNFNILQFLNDEKDIFNTLVLSKKTLKKFSKHIVNYMPIPWYLFDYEKRKREQLSQFSPTLAEDTEKTRSEAVALSFTEKCSIPTDVDSNIHYQAARDFLLFSYLIKKTIEKAQPRQVPQPSTLPNNVANAEVKKAAGKVQQPNDSWQTENENLVSSLCYSAMTKSAIHFGQPGSGQTVPALRDKIRSGHFTWIRLISPIKYANSLYSSKCTKHLYQRLDKLGIINIQQKLTILKKLKELVKEKTAIVRTFHHSIFTENFPDRLLNHYNLLGTPERLSDKRTGGYTNNRYFSEFLFHTTYRQNNILLNNDGFNNEDIPTLLEFFSNPEAHPMHGALMPYAKIGPIKDFGESFLVLAPNTANYAVANFGNMMGKPLDRMPVFFSEFPEVLLSQMSDELFRLFVNFVRAGWFLSNFEMAYNKQDQGNSSYIDVQFPSNTSLTTKENIRHIHFAFNDQIPTFKKLQELQEVGIGVSIHHNPFTDPNFWGAFERKKESEFLLSELQININRAAQFIAETTAEHLTLWFSEEKKNGDPKVWHTFTIEAQATLNSPELHQCQLAGLLFVADLFISMPNRTAMNFLNAGPRTKNVVHYKTQQTFAADPLIFYSNLLNKFLTRIISTLLVSAQNEAFLLTFDTFHPATGKGATEESNQIRPLTLTNQRGQNQYLIDVRWFFDRVLIEVSTFHQLRHNIRDSQNWVVRTLQRYIGQQHVGFQNVHDKGYILINLPLSDLLEKLSRHKFNYQALVIYEDVDNSNKGNIWLAMRADGPKFLGMSTSGGHNNDPYSWVGAFHDIELGKLADQKTWGSTWQTLESKKRQLATKQQPSVVYYSVPASCIDSSVGVDTTEFVKDSLVKVPLYRLGNLSEEMINFLKTNVFKFQTEEQRVNYDKTFHKSMPLRNVDSIEAYCVNQEKEIQEILLAGMNSFIQTDVKVKIIRSQQKVIFNEQYYLKPFEDFGCIHITIFSPLALKYFKEYLDKQSASEISEFLLAFDEQQFTFKIQTNPFVLCSMLSNLKSDFEKHRDNFLQQCQIAVQEQNGQFLKDKENVNLVKNLSKEVIHWIIARLKEDPVVKQFYFLLLLHDSRPDFKKIISEMFNDTTCLQVVSERSEFEDSSANNDTSYYKFATLLYILGSPWPARYPILSVANESITYEYHSMHFYNQRKRIEGYVVQKQDFIHELFLFCCTHNLQTTVSYLLSLERPKTLLIGKPGEQPDQASVLVNVFEIPKKQIKEPTANSDELSQRMAALTLATSNDRSLFNVNYQNAEGYTALHYAAFYGSKEVVQVLLSHGADPKLKAKVKKGEKTLELTPVEYALMRTPMTVKTATTIEYIATITGESLPHSDKADGSAKAGAGQPTLLFSRTVEQKEVSEKLQASINAKWVPKIKLFCQSSEYLKKAQILKAEMDKDETKITQEQKTNLFNAVFQTLDQEKQEAKAPLIKNNKDRYQKNLYEICKAYKTLDPEFEIPREIKDYGESQKRVVKR